MAEYSTILNDVKNDLGITGTYQDNTIQGYIDEVKQFLIDGGVDELIVNSESAKGIISRGVADLWNYGSGGTDLSPYFIKRAIQLASKSSKTKSEIEEFIERIETLETTSSNHEERIETVEDTIDTINDTLTNYGETLDEVDNTLNNHNDRIEGLNTRLTTAEDNINTNTERIENVEENKADTDYVDELVGDIGEEIDNINGEVVGDENV